MPAMAALHPVPVVPLPCGIPTFSQRFGPFEWPRGMRPVLHLFHDWDLFWIRRGELTWTLGDGRALVGGAGSFVLLPPFVAATVAETARAASFWYCHFDFRPPQHGLPGRWGEDVLGPGPRALVPLTFTAREAPGVARAYALLAGGAGDDGRPWRIERAVLDLVAALAAFGVERAKRGDIVRLDAEQRMDRRIASMVARIDAEPAHPWRVAALARFAGLSSGRLHELFRRSFAMGLKQYIVRSRLQLALKLLRRDEGGQAETIRAISERCGFSSQHFFSRQFKTHFHVSPLAYRNGAGIA
jgi:AraC-like DNA-binding protein